MGWWFDWRSAERTKQLRDEFNIRLFIETGTFRGLNIYYWSYHFPQVWGVEKDPNALDISQLRIRDRGNISLFAESSPDFFRHLKVISPTPILFYLDAHFYDPTLPLNHRWVVKDELAAIGDYPNCLILIHDFATPGCGHLIYDGQPLDFSVVQEELRQINSNFCYYTNTRDGCAVHTIESIINIPGLEPNMDTLETISYHNTDRLKYRGILYALPRQLSHPEKFSLISLCD